MLLYFIVCKLKLKSVSRSVRRGFNKERRISRSWKLCWNWSMPCTERKRPSCKVCWINTPFTFPRFQSVNGIFPRRKQKNGTRWLIECWKKFLMTLKSCFKFSLPILLLMACLPLFPKEFMFTVDWCASGYQLGSLENIFVVDNAHISIPSSPLSMQ